MASLACAFACGKGDSGTANPKLIPFSGKLKGIGFSITIPEGFVLEPDTSHHYYWTPKKGHEPDFLVSTTMPYPTSPDKVVEPIVTGKLLMKKKTANGIIAATDGYRFYYWLPIDKVTALKCIGAHLSSPSKAMRALLQKVCLSLRKR